MAKLDLSTIKYFNFPKLPTSHNKYTMRTQGVAGLEYLLEAEKFAII